MAEGLFGGAYFGNPNIQRQGARARALAQQRDVNTLPDPRTYAVVSGLFGTPPDQMGFSVLNPQYEAIQRAAQPAFALGTALGLAPIASVLKAPAMAAGRAGERLAERVVPSVMEGGGLPAEMLLGMSSRTISPLDVYHGTPHRFAPTARNPLGEFDASKIGTGEKAQVYGHGLYTAEAPEVARGYADRLGANYISIDGKPMDFNNPVHIAASILSDPNNAGLPGKQLANAIRYDPKGIVPYGAESKFEEIAKVLESGNLPKFTNQKGNFYKVDLPDAQIAKMLDFDKPLSQQPEIIKALTPEAMGLKLRVAPKSGFMGYVSPDGVPIGLQVKGATPENFRKKWLDRIAEFGEAEGGAGRVIGYLGGTSETSAAQVSQALRQAGIPGIKYFDGTSREAGQGTRNFVVFPGEEKSMTILERNGKVANPRYTDPFANTIDDTTR